VSEVVAVTGATGYVGGRVARLLADRGVEQRLVVRDPARAPELPGAEVRAASRYGAGEEMRAALEGADTLFLVPAEESADRLEQHRTAVDAALAAGVGRIVYLSFLGAAPDATFTLARHHWATEEHIRAAGAPFTFPRMSMYLDFVPQMVGADGVIAGPAGDGRVAMVTRSDVADVAAAIIAGDGHDGRLYDVTGTQPLSLAEIALQLSELSGKRIAYKDETLEEARERRLVPRARLAARSLDQHLHRDRVGRARDGQRHGRAARGPRAADAGRLRARAPGLARARASRLDCSLHEGPDRRAAATRCAPEKGGPHDADQMPALPATVVRRARRRPGKLPVLRRSARPGVVAAIGAGRLG
jgi:NAD(P)H dehydrogenase (quinone)